MKISILIASRKNSKYLAKFLLGFQRYTKHPENVEVKVILPESDTWNKELIELHPEIEWVRESYNYGRAGLHVYFNDLAKKATGDWLIYFCDDHFISKDGWDDYLLREIERWGLDHNGIYCIIPKLENTGPVNQIVSRGFYNALGALGRNAWIDSYINDVAERIPQDHVFRLNEPTFYDFSADQPSPMSDAAQQSVYDPNFREGHPDYLPYHDPRTRQLVEVDALTLTNIIKGGK